MTNDEFLTRRWNNWLLLGMGVPTLVYATVVLSTSAVPDFAGFVGILRRDMTLLDEVRTRYALRFCPENPLRRTLVDEHTAIVIAVTPGSEGDQYQEDPPVHGVLPSRFDRVIHHEQPKR